MELRYHSLEGLPDELAGVPNEGADMPSVREVKIVSIQPLVLNIVDEKLDIRRYPQRLNRT